MKIQAQAPCRISLFGGSSDLPVFYENNNGGCVISMAINLYKTVEIHDLSQLAKVTYSSDNSFIKLFLDEFNVDAIQVLEHSDIPLNSGMGGSASMGVTLVAALSRLQGKDLTKRYLDRLAVAEKAWGIANNKLGLYSGKQDEIAAAVGGMNYITFGKHIVVSPIDRHIADFWQQRLVLFYTGETRKDPKIQERLKELTLEQTNSISRIKEICNEALEYINSVNVKKVSRLLNQSWEHKKKSNELVSNKRIDDLYTTALANGATSGKLNGSGGGGHMVFLSEPENHEKLKKALEVKGAKWIDYSVDWNGVQIRCVR